MQEILVRACCFVAIIILGYILRRVGVFKEDDFKVLSKIVLKITLPAAIITNFAGKSIDFSMLLIVLVGFCSGLLYMILGYLINKRKGREQQAFGLLNLSGYNIGNFTTPFVQSFLGPMGVITTSVYDVGNAFVCLGGAYSVASSVKGNGDFSLKRILRTLAKSVAFDCYLIMIVMSLARISLPGPVVSLAELIGNIEQAGFPFDVVKWGQNQIFRKQTEATQDGQAGRSCGQHACKQFLIRIYHFIK